MFAKCKYKKIINCTNTLPKMYARKCFISPVYTYRNRKYKLYRSKRKLSVHEKSASDKLFDFFVGRLFKQHSLLFESWFDYLLFGHAIDSVHVADFKLSRFIFYSQFVMQHKVTYLCFDAHENSRSSERAEAQLARGDDARHQRNATGAWRPHESRDTRARIWIIATNPHCPFDDFFWHRFRF